MGADHDRVGSPPDTSGTPGSQIGSQAPATSTNKGSATSQENMKPGSSFAANQLTGQIKSIDKSQKSITIDQSGKQQSLKLTDNATVFMNGRLASLDDLKEGQQVRAAYEDRGGQKSLRWIEVTPAGGSTGSMKNDTGMHDQSGAMKNDQSGSMKNSTGMHDQSDTNETGSGSIGSSTGASSGKIGSTANVPSSTVVGTVLAIDSDKDEVTLGQGTQKWKLSLRDDASIMMNGEKATTRDIKEGAQVRASLDSSKKAITKLEILSSGTGKSDSTLPDDSMKKSPAKPE